MLANNCQCVLDKSCLKVLVELVRDVGGISCLPEREDWKFAKLYKGLKIGPRSFLL